MFFCFFFLFELKKGFGISFLTSRDVLPELKTQFMIIYQFPNICIILGKLDNELLLKYYFYVLF